MYFKMQLYLMIFGITSVAVIGITTYTTTTSFLGQSVLLSCTIISNESKTTWSRRINETLEIVHQGQSINKNIFNADKLSVHKINNDTDQQFDLKITNVSKQDEGLYCCLQLSKNFTNQSCTTLQIIEISIHGVKNTSMTAYFGEKIALTCELLTKNIDGVDIFWIYNDSIKASDESNILNYTLEVTTDLHEKPFTCMANVTKRNSAKVLKEEFRLLVRCVPEEPIISSVRPFVNGFRIIWTHVADDNCNQSYFAQYRSVTESDWKTLVLHSEKSEILISNLKEDSLYQVLMFAENKMGKRVSSKVYIVRTDKSEKFYSTTIFLYIVSLVSGIFIICLASVFYIKNRKSDRQTNSNNEISAETHSLQNNTSRSNYSEIEIIDNERNDSHYIIVD